MISELPHRRFFSVNKKCSLAPSNVAVPGEQLPLIGVSRKSINGVDRAADWNILIEESHIVGSVDDLPRESAQSGKTDEDDCRFLSPQVLPQVVADPASCAHARTCHNDRAAGYSVDGN